MKKIISAFIWEKPAIQICYHQKENKIAYKNDFNYWKSEKFWLGKLLEHPEIMTQGETLEELEEKLDEMYFSGLINRGLVKEGETETKYYGSAPIAVGFFEYQLNRLTPEFFKDAHEYLHHTFFKEEYHKSGVPQLRVIPLNQTVENEQSIAQYDDIKAVIENISEVAPFPAPNSVAMEEKKAPKL